MSIRCAFPNYVQLVSILAVAVVLCNYYVIHFYLFSSGAPAFFFGERSLHASQASAQRSAPRTPEQKERHSSQAQPRPQQESALQANLRQSAKYDAGSHANAVDDHRVDAQRRSAVDRMDRLILELLLQRLKQAVCHAQH